MTCAPPKQLSKAAFLDRDGVINVDTYFLHRAEECRWTVGAHAAIRRLRSEGYLVVVITNQSGVARGYFSEETLQAFLAWYQQACAGAGAALDAIYYCPHHPEYPVGAGQSCDCRKPAPGMIERAASDLGIDLSASFLIGNEQSDLEAARAAGMPGHLFDGSDLALFVDQILDATSGEGSAR